MTPYGVIPWSAHIYYYLRNIYMENFEKVMPAVRRLTIFDQNNKIYDSDLEEIFVFF